MNKALYVLGGPGTGKTTLVERLLRPYERGPAFATLGLMWVEPVYLGSGTVVGLVLGRRRERFSGTDALGMAVQPDALAWLASAGEFSPWIIGEGQRLGNAGFLYALADHADLTVVHLVADEAVRLERCAGRGSAQNEAWMRGSVTRAAKAAERCLAVGIRVWELDANRSADEVAAEVEPWMTRTRRGG